MSLSPGDRTKLARVLGLLGSPHMGERDVAALAAHRIVSGRGLTWLDVLGASTAAGQRQGTPYAAPRSFAGDAWACLGRPGLFTPWEREFLAGIVSRRRLSSRQLGILAGLVERLRAAGGHPG